MTSVFADGLAGMMRGERLVDLVGIEPTTSSMPWKRAPSCATGPREKTFLYDSRPPVPVSQTTGAQSGLAKANKMGILNRTTRMTTRSNDQPRMNLTRVFAVLLSFIALAGVSLAQTAGSAPPVSYASIA